MILQRRENVNEMRITKSLMCVSGCVKKNSSGICFLIENNYPISSFHLIFELLVHYYFGIWILSPRQSIIEYLLPFLRHPHINI